MKTLAIVGATVLTMTGADLRDATVLIEGNRIVAVGPRARVTVPAGAQVIDARGKYLLPGLIDAHLHLTHPAVRGQEERALALSAQHGITTARVMWGDSSYRALRDRIAGGELFGPDLVLAAPALMPNSATPEAARSLIAAQKAAGYELVKLMAGPAALFDSTVAAARAHALPLSGHVIPQIGLVRTAESYVSLEHLDGLIEALLPEAHSPLGGFFGLALVQRADTARLPGLITALKRTGAVIVPTEYSMEHFAAQMNPGAFAAFRDIRRSFLRQAAAAGIPLAVGSDAVNAGLEPGTAMLRELDVLAAAGIPNVQLLRAATVTAARLLRRPDRGTIAPGQRADLLLLNADPRESISAIGAVAGVVLAGSFSTVPAKR